MLVAVELAFVVDAFVSVGMLVVATGGVGGGALEGTIKGAGLGMIDGESTMTVRVEVAVFPALSVTT